MKTYKCQNCGAQLEEKSDEKFYCPYCRFVYRRESVDKAYAIAVKQLEIGIKDTLKSGFDQAAKQALIEERLKNIANRRKNLYIARTREFVNNDEVKTWATEIRKYNPYDVQANFYFLAANKNWAELNNYLRKINARDNVNHFDGFIDYLEKGQSVGKCLLSINDLIDSSISKASSYYQSLHNKIGKAVERERSGVFDETLPRDVFVAYSSKDKQKAYELVEYLEERGVTCYISMRNLPKGIDAERLYNDRLKRAMDHCQTFLFVSSKNSRSRSCDAYSIELRYIMEQDIKLSENPNYYCNNYQQLIEKYRNKCKQRIEYLIEDYSGKGDVYEQQIKTFFSGYSWCRDKQRVLDVISKYKANLQPVSSTEERLLKENAELRKKAEQQNKQTPESFYNQGLACANKQNYGQAVPYFKKAAELEHKIAQCTMGYYYETGKGVEKNLKVAFDYYQKAAFQNYATAQFNLGLCHEYGKGTAKDLTMALAWYKKALDNGYKKAEESIKQVQLKINPAAPQKTREETAKDFYRQATEYARKNDLVKAFEYYKKAAALDDRNAQCNLGLCYETSKGVKRDLSSAFYWYQKAAEQDHTSAQFNLGLCYESGKGVEKDLKKALFWLEKASSKGHVRSKDEIEKIKKILATPKKSEVRSVGESLEREKEPTAEELLEKANEYHNKKDYENSFINYRKAAEMGNLKAQFYLAVSYEKGYGVQASEKKAAQWFERAAKRGYAIAQFKLGVCYQYGRGVSQNYEKATNWFYEAAKQGQPLAQNNLANNYSYGYGTNKNYEQAAYWYQQAAERGNVLAQKSLGEIYHTGRGVVQNSEKAYFWFNEAAKQGDSEAIQRVVELQNSFDSSLKRSKELEEQERNLRRRAREIRESEAEIRIQEILLNNLYAKESRIYSPIYQREARKHNAPNSSIYGPKTEKYYKRRKSKALAVFFYFTVSFIADFYLGFIGKGLFKIAICFTGLGIFVSMLWGYKQAIDILRGYTDFDAKGRPLE